MRNLLACFTSLINLTSHFMHSHSYQSHNTFNNSISFFPRALAPLGNSTHRLYYAHTYVSPLISKRMKEKEEIVSSVKKQMVSLKSHHHPRIVLYHSLLSWCISGFKILLLTFFTTKLFKTKEDKVCKKRLNPSE
jgi:hypothetical protein